MPAALTPEVSGEQREGLGSEQRNFPVNTETQISFKADQNQLRLYLPTLTETQGNCSELCQQLQHRLDAGHRFWPAQGEVEVMAGDHLLESHQIQQLAMVLSSVDLQLRRIHTHNRQTAVAAVQVGYSVEQPDPNRLTSESAAAEASPSPISSRLPYAEPLYLQTTLRSGSEIRHPGTVVILGDLNPGSSIVADGDILVWGRLRGVAHAGANGNHQCQILALQMEPTQLRIADRLARAPETPPTQFYPEVAYIAETGICISRASDIPHTPHYQKP